MPAFKRNTFNVQVSPGAKGIADIANILLGNSDPGGMVALQGQTMGADLANKIASGRQTGLENQKLEIGLEDMKLLRQLFPQGSPEHQAVIDPNFAGGQLGLGRRADNSAVAQAREGLANSGATVNVGGKQLPLSILSELFAGQDINQIGKLPTQIENILNQIGARDKETDAKIKVQETLSALNQAKSATEGSIQKDYVSKRSARDQKTVNDQKQAEQDFKTGLFKQGLKAQEVEKMGLELNKLADELNVAHNMEESEALKLKLELMKLHLETVNASKPEGSKNLTPAQILTAETGIATSIMQSFPGESMTSEQIASATSIIMKGLVENGEGLLAFNKNPNTDPSDFISEKYKKELEKLGKQIVDSNVGKKIEDSNVGRPEPRNANDILAGLGITPQQEQSAQGTPEVGPDILSSLGVSSQQPQGPEQQITQSPVAPVAPQLPVPVAPAPVSPKPQSPPLIPDTKTVLGKYFTDLSQVFPPNAVDVIAKYVSTGSFEEVEGMITYLRENGQKEQADALEFALDNLAFAQQNK
jgi:hypothetical protein